MNVCDIIIIIHTLLTSISAFKFTQSIRPSNEIQSVFDVFEIHVVSVYLLDSILDVF